MGGVERNVTKLEGDIAIFQRKRQTAGRERLEELDDDEEDGPQQQEHKHDRHHRAVAE